MYSFIKFYKLLVFWVILYSCSHRI